MLPAFPSSPIDLLTIYLTSMPCSGTVTADDFCHCRNQGKGWVGGCTKAKIYQGLWDPVVKKGETGGRLPL